MPKQKLTTKRVLWFVLILFFGDYPVYGQLDFPFFRSFLNKELDHVTFISPYVAPGGPVRDNSAVLVSGVGLQLTNGLSQVGAFYLPDHTFTTDLGLLIEFEYMMIGPANEDTDGICMFLIDADPLYVGNNIRFGFEGAGFGYTHRWTINSHPSIPNITLQRTMGMKGGYVAVALDNSNFKNLRTEAQEIRNGISYTPTLNSWPVFNYQNSNYNTRSNVTIRGAAGRGSKTIRININDPDYNETTLTAAEGYWGFPVLITRHTGWSTTYDTNDPSNLRNNASIRLNTSTGLFEAFTPPYLEKGFNIAGGDVFDNSSQPQYRKAIIVLEKNPNSSVGGFKITVRIQHGNDYDTVIQDFTFPSQITYHENGYPGSTTGYVVRVPRTPDAITYTVPPPTRLAIGFMGSTGHLTSYRNVIKNLRITPVYAANTANDDLRDHRRGPATIRQFDNDLGYKEENGTSVGSKEHLDPNTFRFWSDPYTCLGENRYEYPVAGKGKWVYNPTTAETSFFPVRGFKGQVEILYDVKGKYAPYNDEQCRSSLAKISITIDDNQP